jgi:transcription elongation factor GreA
MTTNKTKTSAQNNELKLTEQGFEEIKLQLAELKEKLPKAIERVATARSFGDLSENSEYHASREDLSFLEGKIIELEEILARAQVVKNGTASKNKAHNVQLGSIVTVEVKGKKIKYNIVGEWEANPSEKKISHKSPLGRALVGKKHGDEVEVQVPVGKMKYKIVEIE